MMSAVVKRHTKKYLQGVGNLLFPPLCPVCGEGLPAQEAAMCLDCQKEVVFIVSPLCSCCGRSLADSAGDDHLCGICLRRHPAFTTARGVAHYQEPLSTLLHRLKYQGDTYVLPALKFLLQDIDIFPLQDEDRIVPVPLHKKRLRKRGFNQAQLLAGILFPYQRRQILLSVLQRVRHTVPQTGLSGKERRMNLQKAFVVQTPEAIAERRIILVDDVFTTGTTVNECSRVLLNAGAVEVHVVTMARVKE